MIYNVPRCNNTSNGENYSDAAAGSRPGNATDKVTGATSTGTYVTLTVGSLSVTATTLHQQLLLQQMLTLVMLGLTLFRLHGILNMVDGWC